MRKLLEEKLRRFEALEKQLVDPEVLASPLRLSAIAREHGSLSKLVTKYRRFRQFNAQVAEAMEMLGDPDRELRELAEAELADLKEQREVIWNELLDMTIGGEDANRTRCMLEIRAGTGGEEAALFARDLYEMYRRYAEDRRWKLEILSANPTELGGFKEIVLGLEGEGVFRQLQYESGGHRVQRVPETEAQGRIHTSAATVAVMAEPEDVEIKLSPDDLSGRHLPRQRPRWAARQQDRLGRPAHAPGNGARRRHPGRKKPAQKPRQGASGPEKPTLRPQAGRGRQEAGVGSQEQDRLGRPQPADPHLQFPAEPRDRPPHQPHALQARQHHRRGAGSGRRRPDGTRAPGPAGPVRHVRVTWQVPL